MVESLRVLILEDNSGDAELIQFELQEAGLSFVARVVTTEEDFLRELQEYCPDLILSDYDLPQYSGALALAHGRMRCPDTPFILVTGAVGEDRAIEILTQGAKDYVLKGRLQQRLVPAVRRALAEAGELKARMKAEEELREAHRTLEERVKARTADLEAEIAARENMEKALLESEKRSRILYQESPIPTFTWQKNGDDFILVDFNRAAIHITNDKVGTFLGRSAAELYRKRPQILRDMNLCYKEQSIVRRDITSRHFAPGRVLSVHYGFIPPDMIIVHMEDQTQRKKAEEALWQATERLEMAQRAANVGTWDWNIVTGHIEWSTQMFNLFGLDPETHTASFDTWKRIIHPDDREIADLRIEEAMRRHTSLSSDYRIVLPDGQIRWINAVGEGKYDDQDRPTRMLGICMDITDRKRMEMALRESEQLYHAIGESIDYGVWVCAPDGRNIYASKSFLRLVGLTQEQCSNFGWSDVLHPDDAERTITAWKECVQAGGTWDIEHRFRGVDGQWHPILARGVPVRNEKGEVIYWAGINLDIKKLKQIEMDLKERTRQLEDANRELESFSYSVSHDLRAPLRAIDGYSRMILRQQGDKFDENTRSQFDVIRNNAKMMGQLIDDLLALSRMGRRALSMSLLNVEDLTNDVWGELKTISPDRPADLKIDPVPPVMGDRLLIKQVLVNLLSNAVKFSSVREAPLIEVGGYGTKGENVYYVRDNGVGFDMQYHNKLFGAFQRLHSTDDFEGTGVGLAIVQRIIHRHGGRVWAESEIDRGATFYFTLPA